MKRTYIAPAAEITFLAPNEPVAMSWKTNQATGNDRWWFSQNNYFGETITSGTTYWYDFGMDEINDT